MVRDADASEIDTVAELLRTAYAAYVDQFPPRMWRAYSAEIGAVQARVSVATLLVAVRDERVVGSVTLYPRGALDGHDWPDGFASLRLLAVPPTERGAGAGRLLVDACIARARAAGASWLGLHTAPFMAAAIRLYEQVGFVRAPEHDFDPHAHYGDADSDGAQIPGLAFVLPLTPHVGGDAGR